MAHFNWRLTGEETLAYLADVAELAAVASEDFSLGQGEAFAILDSEGLVMAVEGENLPDAIAWLRDALARGEEFRVVFLATGQAEIVRHMWFSDISGSEVRGAIKLRFQAIPARSADLLAVGKGSPIVTVSDLERLLGEEVEAALAARVGGVSAPDLAGKAELAEEVRADATARVRELASRVGIKVTGMGLAWGLDPERAARMAAAAERHREGTVALAGRLEEALKDREERLKALKAAKVETETVSWEKEESALEGGGSEAQVDTAYVAEPKEEPGLGDELPEEEDLAAPCAESPDEGGLSACLYRSEVEGEEVELKAADGDLEEAGPAGMDLEDTPEPGPEDFAFAANAEELTVPLPAVSGFVDGDEPPGEVKPIEGEFAEPSGAASEPEAAKTDVEAAPFVSLAEMVAHAPGWRLYGGESLACVVDEVEIPRLFRKDFELGEDEAITVLRGTRCEDFIVKGIERTSGALTWISKLHGGGKDVSVLWSRTSELVLEFDVAGTDGEAEEIFGVVKIGCRVPALSAPGLYRLMKERTSLGYQDLADYLCVKATGVYTEALVGEAVSRTGHALLEHALKKSVEREASAIGLDILSLSFDWAKDEDSNSRVDWGYRKRCAKSWRFAIERNLLDARRKIELLARRIENISAYLHLSENAKPDLKKMLIRSAFGAEALKAAPPRREAAEAELKKIRGEIVALKDGLAMLVETGDLEIRRGAPHIESRLAPKVITDEEEGFLTDAFEGEGWEAEVTLAGSGAAFSPLSAGRPIDQKSLEEAKPEHPASENHGVLVGGGGAKITVQTRCIHCMAPLRRESNTCGNCGRRV